MILEITLAIFFILAYLLTLYFIDKSRCKKLIKTLVTQAEGLDLAWVTSQLSTSQSKLPLAKTISQYVVTKTASTLIEKKLTEKVTDIIKPNVEENVLGEKIDLGTDTSKTVVDLAHEVLQSDSKGVISVFGEAEGNTEKDGVDWKVGVGYAKKIK